jgi:hypothetical protein
VRLDPLNGGQDGWADHHDDESRANQEVDHGDKLLRFPQMPSMASEGGIIAHLNNAGKLSLVMAGGRFGGFLL